MSNVHLDLGVTDDMDVVEDVPLGKEAPVDHEVSLKCSQRDTR